MLLYIMGNKMYYINCLQDILVFISKVCFASGIGAWLGRERGQYKEYIGARTFSIICLSACLLAILSLELQTKYSFDFVRLLSYGISSIGFLGAGLIWKQDNHIEGLTTASSLFVLMPLGYLIGLAYYLESFIVFILVYIILEFKDKENYHEK